MASKTPPQRLRQDTLTANIVRNEIWRRANVENEHFVLCVVGREGSGKSGTALSLASALDDDFHAGRVAFRPANVLRMIRSDETERGSVMVLDEAGVGMGARSWYDKAQIQLNKTLQTIRDDNQILILTLPGLGELDSQTVNRLHAYAEMTSLDDGEMARFKFKFLHPQRGPSGETYEEFPRRRVGGRRCRVERLTVGPPPEDLWAAYEGRKAEFKAELYDETIDSLEDDPEPETPKEIAEQIVSDGSIEEYVNENNGQEYIDRDLIAVEHDLGATRAKRVKKALQKRTDRKLM